MGAMSGTDWQGRIVPPEKALSAVKPGMRILLGTGVAEPRTLVASLADSIAANLQDLELIQLAGFGTPLSADRQNPRKYRYKTFFSGHTAPEAVASGRVDLIPCRFSRIPQRIRAGRISVDAVFVKIAAPDAEGWCSLGAVVDVAREAMERADLVVGEITPSMPRTCGDTRVPLSAFDWLVASDTEPLYFDRWPVDAAYERIAANAAPFIEDGACIAFSFGPLYEALAGQLSDRCDLGVHTPFFTDALMDLVESGAVTNRLKKTFPGRCVTSYAVGTPALSRWLNDNPRVAFHPIDTVFNPAVIGRQSRVVAVFRAEAADLTGRIALPSGRGIVAAGPEEARDFIDGAELSPGGLTLFALPSRNPSGEANIRISLEGSGTLSAFRESADVVVTEYGAADLGGRTLRERAQALIDIAHPDDRRQLFDGARALNMVYADQIPPLHCPATDPSTVATAGTFKNGVTVRFRAIKPSDEEEMRRLFYRFSDEAVYYRYFSPIKSMPHEKMQDYVNADCDTTLSVVGLAGPAGRERIVAEARYVRDPGESEADVAFVVDDDFQGLGIGSFLFSWLVKLARERGIRYLIADVLTTNRAMMQVFRRGGVPMTVRMMDGSFRLHMDLGERLSG